MSAARITLWPNGTATVTVLADHLDMVCAHALLTAGGWRKAPDLWRWSVDTDPESKITEAITYLRAQGLAVRVHYPAQVPNPEPITRCTAPTATTTPDRGEERGGDAVNPADNRPYLLQLTEANHDTGDFYTLGGAGFLTESEPIRERERARIAAELAEGSELE